MRFAPQPPASDAAPTPGGTALLDAAPEPPTLDTDVTHRHALAHDASHYLMIPEALATPTGEQEVAALMARASASGTPLTFRSGGTSLCGQAQAPGILADTRRHFRGIEVLDDGERVRVGPGATVRQVNARLIRHRRRLGPDPASETACTIGGVVANNSSGMAAGTTQNSYRTLESLRFVLPGGTVVDTSEADADARLRHDEPELHAGLVRLMRQVREDPAARRQITERFALKNTIGYGINALLDFDTPADALAHLIIGSEGTLAFVCEAVYRTVPIERHVATGLLVMPSLQSATAALDDLLATGVATAELLDNRSLTVAQGLQGAPQEVLGIDVDQHAALLLEQRSNDPAQLEELVAATSRAVGGLSPSADYEMTTDPGRQTALWTARKGLYASVAGARPTGMTALLEDVVVPVPALEATCAGLQRLFDVHGYDSSVIFGHAKDGNIHFLVNERLGEGSHLEAFTDDMVNLVIDQGGNIKAEHGTGRAMAPFVERQYGSELYQVMREIKRLVDPAGILNPGVVLTEDPTEHMQNLKPTTEIEEEADRCVECGYCEPVCPSKDLTLTPRQRIVLRRDAKLAEERGDMETANAIRASYEYEGVETCAVDGMCVTACPVSINTGDLVRRLRAEEAGEAANAGWKLASEHWGAVTNVASTAMSAAGLVRTAGPVGRALPKLATTAARAVAGTDLVPSYRDELPSRGGAVRRSGPRGRADAEVSAIYMPACMHTMFGAPDGDPDTTGAAFSALLARAGLRAAVPDGAQDLCCGTPFSSKGMLDAKNGMHERLREVLGTAAAELASADAPLPVVVDGASCTEGVLGALQEEGHDTGIKVMDAITYLRRYALESLEVRHPAASVTVHPTCSATHLGATDDLVALARFAVADPEADVVVPAAWGCCGYAGDRGMLHPELTYSATRAEAAEVAERETEWYVSANRPCEMGMTAATGHTYHSVLELVDAVTR